MTNEKDAPSDFVSMSEFDSRYAYRVMMIFVGLVLVVMYVEGMLTPSLRSIMQTFNGITEAQVSLVLSTYLVGGVAMTPIVGKLGDIYGKKKMLTITMVTYAVAVSVTGFSPNFTFMVIARGIQGIGLSIMPLGFSLIREEFPKELVPKAQALISAMFGAGFAISLPLGSLVSQYLGWRMTYHTAVPFVIALSLVAYFYIRESRFRRPDTKIDYGGAGLLAIVLALFVLALSEAPSWGWDSLAIHAMFIAGAALVFPLILYELRYTRKGGDAILNFKLLAERNVLVANVVLAIAGMGMFLSMQALTFRFEYPPGSGLGLGTFDTGLSLIPFAIGTIIFGPIAGALVKKTGVKPLAVLGGILSAIGFLLQATIPGYYGILTYEFIMGSGLSLLNGTLINYIVLTVNPRDMGLATAMNGTFRSLGSSIGAPVAGSILTTFTATYMVYSAKAKGLVPDSLPSHASFAMIFIIAAVAFIAAAIMIPLGREVLGKRSNYEKKVAGIPLEAEASPK